MKELRLRCLLGDGDRECFVGEGSGVEREDRFGSALAELLPTLSDEDRTIVADAAPVLVQVVADLSVDPAVYAHLGIEGGREMARANPHHTATIAAGLAKLTTFLSEIGVIDDAHRATWGALVA